MANEASHGMTFWAFVDKHPRLLALLGIGTPFAAAFAVALVAILVWTGHTISVAGIVVGKSELTRADVAGLEGEVGRLNARLIVVESRTDPAVAVLPLPAPRTRQAAKAVGTKSQAANASGTGNQINQFGGVEGTGNTQQVTVNNAHDIRKIPPEAPFVVGLINSGEFVFAQLLESCGKVPEAFSEARNNADLWFKSTTAALQTKLGPQVSERFKEPGLAFTWKNCGQEQNGYLSGIQNRVGNLRGILKDL